MATWPEFPSATIKWSPCFGHSVSRPPLPSPVLCISIFTFAYLEWLPGHWAFEFATPTLILSNLNATGIRNSKSENTRKSAFLHQIILFWQKIRKILFEKSAWLCITCVRMAKCLAGQQLKHNIYSVCKTAWYCDRHWKYNDKW